MKTECFTPSVFPVFKVIKHQHSKSKNFKIMRTTFNYAHLLDYLPTRYSANDEQTKDRYAVYDFKNGNCSDRIFNAFAKYIKEQAGNNKSNWVVCFIPASTDWKTKRRYSNLASRLQSATGVKATLSAITREIDKESGHLNGKVGNPIEGVAFDSSEFRGKNVILIDDVITRGKTFMLTANELLNRGASDVIGLFVAKTVNPDWHRQIA
jgi:ATP-dependent DNA helicase RecQ